MGIVCSKSMSNSDTSPLQESAIKEEEIRIIEIS